MKHLLFVCSLNRWRSPTAEAVFAGYPDLDVRSAGLNKGAEIFLNAEDVEWADYIFVMEKSHQRKLRDLFKAQLTTQKVICLGIPDKYRYMDATLIEIFERKVPYFIA